MQFFKSKPKISSDLSGLYHNSPNALSGSLLWLLRLRWIAIIFLGLAVIPALRLALLRREDLLFYFGALSVLLFVNIASQLSERRLNQTSELGLLFHLGIDVLCLSSMLSLMGGAWNPLCPLLYFHAALGGLLLRKKTSWIYLGIIAFCFFSLNLVVQLPPILEASPIPRYIQLPSQLIVAFAIWALTKWLSANLEDSYQKNRAFEERKSRLDKLRAAGALSAGFSHEFATPLNTLKMRLDRICRKNDIDSDDENISKESLAKCEEILRKMSASNTNKESIRIELVEMGKLLQEITHSWNVAHDSPRVDFQNNKRGKIICEIPPILFTNMILALLDNSKEATANKVKIFLNSSESSSIISISDTGIGWPSEVKKYFGQPFLSLKQRGTGLGLYNAKTLLEALGGSLEIFHSYDSDYSGAGLRLTIPLAVEENL